MREPEKTRWRAQARDWLRADLAAWGKALDTNTAAVHEDAKRRFEQWRSDPDLECLRTPAELEKLPAIEKKDCLSMWADVDVALARCKR